MDSVKVVHRIEEFQKFLNKNGIMEIALRDKHSKFKAFQKISLSYLNKGQDQAILNNVYEAINKSNNVNMKNAKMLSNIKNLNQIDMVLNGLNLCSTVSGFAIMYMKLNKISNQINKVLSLVKKGQDIHAHYEFKKILSTHSDMLDHRKTQHFYTEEQMRELVDGEYNVLCMLNDVFIKGVSEDTETLIYSIISLSTMLAVSLTYFDEIYYFNNKETINSDDIWHSSHLSWTKIYDDLTSIKFMETLQDFAMFNLGLNTQDCDVYCICIADTIKSAKKKIEDNQFLLIALDNQKMLSDFKAYNNQEIKDSIQSALEEYQLSDDDEVRKSINIAMKQVGITS